MQFIGSASIFKFRRPWLKFVSIDLHQDALVTKLGHIHLLDTFISSYIQIDKWLEHVSMTKHICGHYIMTANTEFILQNMTSKL